MRERRRGGGLGLWGEQLCIHAYHHITSKYSQFRRNLSTKRYYALVQTIFNT